MIPSGGARLVAVVIIAAAACDRSAPAGEPVGVPPDAVFVLAAPTLAQLRRVASYVEPLPVDEGSDEQKPAWYACERQICVLRRADVAERAHVAEAWRVPDGDGSLVVWGAKDEAALDSALARWARGAAAPTGWAGFIEPGPLFERWKPTNPRSKELLERATFQAGRIDFVVKQSASRLDAELRMQARPGEPRFVADLGEPLGPLPDIAALTDGTMVGIARLSADPMQTWRLLRSVLTPGQREDLERFAMSLKEEAALDLDVQVVEALSGHVALLAYEIGKNAQPADLLSLRATREIVVFGVRDREPLRLALDAWTQLSRGRLQVQSVGKHRQEWAWLEDDEIAWTVMLGRDYLAFVDAPDGLDRVRRWEEPDPDADPAGLADVLGQRGVEPLLHGGRRSGIYVDVVAFRARFGELLGTFPAVESVTVTAEPDELGELVRVSIVPAASVGGLGGEQ